MAANGTYADPSHKSCFKACTACFRCEDKGRYSKCGDCSGCFDPAGKIDVDPDHYCACTQGVLRWRTRKGQLIISRYPTNPFEGKLKEIQETQDMRDWKSYLQEYREKMENPYVSPISANINGKQAYYDDNYVGFYDENGNQVG